MEYDIVLCVGPKHKKIAIKVIKSLFLFLKGRRIIVITARESIRFLKNRVRASRSIVFIDEDTAIENVDLKTMRDILQDKTGLPENASWYFQQFLKMSACNLPGLTDHYLIWDSDTILLKPIDFFDKDGTILFNGNNGIHKPYFDVLKKVLGLDKQVEYSFITEHFMVRKIHMKELIETLQDRAPRNMSWIRFMLNSIKQECVSESGFSEYEMYGNFVSLHHKNGYRFRYLQSTRVGAQVFGMNPNRFDLFRLMRNGNTYASFEKWQVGPLLPRLKEKIRSGIYYLIYVMRGMGKEMRNAATLICN